MGRAMDFEEIERIKFDGMPFVPDEDVYIKFESIQKARESALWMLAQGVNYMGFNEDRIYICRSDFLKIAKIMGFKVEEEAG